jgi:hypothetical protein
MNFCNGTCYAECNFSVELCHDFLLYADELKTTVLFVTWPDVAMGFPVTSFICAMTWPAPAGSGDWPGLWKTI